MVFYLRFLTSMLAWYNTYFVVFYRFYPANLNISLLSELFCPANLNIVLLSELFYPANLNIVLACKNGPSPPQATAPLHHKLLSPSTPSYRSPGRAIAVIATPCYTSTTTAIGAPCLGATPGFIAAPCLATTVIAAPCLSTTVIAAPCLARRHARRHAMRAVACKVCRVLKGG